MRNSENGFDKVISAIKLLKEAKMDVGVALVPTKVNMSDVDRVIEICDELGVSEFRMQPLMLLGRAKENLKDYALTYNEYRKLVRHSRKKVANYTMRLEWGDPVDHLLFMNNSKLDIPYIGVNAYGDITVTPYIPISFGNVNEHSLQEYVDKGISLAYTNLFFNKVISKVSKVDDLDLNRKIGLPEVFKEEWISLDILNPDVDKLTNELIEKYNL